MTIIDDNANDLPGSVETPVCATPKLTILDKEFTYIYLAFVDDGGLDRLTCVSEAWERRFRQQVYCGHNIARQSCTSCRKTIPQYGSY